MPRDFRIRLLLAVALPSVLVAATLGMLWWNWTLQTLESALRERVEATAKQLAISAELPLFSGDTQSLQGIVDSVGTDDGDIRGVAITDPSGGLLAHRGPTHGIPDGLSADIQWAPQRGDRQWHLIQPVAAAPIAIDDMAASTRAVRASRDTPPLGYVVLHVSLDRLSRARDRMLMLGGGVIALSILFSLALTAWLARGVIRPLSRIIQGVEAMGKGHLETRIGTQDGDVFLPLVHGINKMARDVQLTQHELEQRIEAATRELREAKARAEEEARIDPLTGLYNRRAFMERATDELRRARRYGASLSLVMIDLDHFKSINDRWGHAMGDRVLVAFAEILKQHMRGVDVVARIGGEEFIMLMTEAGYADATQVAERIRNDIKASSLDLEDTHLTWTASLGLTILTAEDESVSAALVRADKALYRAKQLGRDRIEAEMPDAPTSTQDD